MIVFDLNCGVFVLVVDEVDVVELCVMGVILCEFDGMLLCNGLNLLGGCFDGNDMLLWWLEVVMLYVIVFDDGCVVGYWNCWVCMWCWVVVYVFG